MGNCQTCYIIQDKRKKILGFVPFNVCIGIDASIAKPIRKGGENLFFFYSKFLSECDEEIRASQVFVWGQNVNGNFCQLKVLIKICQECGIQELHQVLPCIFFYNRRTFKGNRIHMGMTFNKILAINYLHNRKMMLLNECRLYVRSAED